MAELTAAEPVGPAFSSRATAPEGDKPFPLPLLRDDLTLLPAPPDKIGAPAWSIHDPVRGRYFRIGHAAFEMLSRWSRGRSDRLIASVRAETVLDPNEDDVRRLSMFLHANGLLSRGDPAAAAEFERIDRAGRPTWWKWLVHNYLFVRIPLVRPDRFLERTRWLADCVASPVVGWLVLLSGAIGILLVLRRWDAFTATFLSFANWQGLLWLAITMTGVKVLHELGHAYTAKRYNCRVPTMGVAFLVLYPVLYTDTTDTWRLTSREQRLRVGAAGIRVELSLALICTFLWSFLPEGPAKSAAFLIATASWVTTLLVNLNPFLRFDGYYLASDWLDVPNLQPRAFALTRWWLRERLFGFGLPAPEPMAPRLRTILICYGIATWIYRLFLFLAIALIVYHFFFKALGLLLFVVELAWFIGLPIVREIREWGRHGAYFRPNISLFVTLGVLAVMVWLLVTPWNTTIRAPALWTSAESTPVLTAHPAKLAEIVVPDGARIAAGTVLYRFDAPQLAARRRMIDAKLKQIEIALEQAQVDVRRRGGVAALEQQRRQSLAHKDRLDAQIARLTVRAPISGFLRDVPPELVPGLWVAEQQPLGRVVSPEGVIRAYVIQEDLSRLRDGAAVTFIPDDASRPLVQGHLATIDRTAVERLDRGYLAAPNGGDIPARAEEVGGAERFHHYEPLVSVYRVEAVPDARRAPERTLRGTLHIEGPALSYIQRLARTVVAVFIRESGF